MDKLSKKPKNKTEKQKKRKKRLIILGVIAASGFLFLFLAVQVTSHSRFCASCHYMKPFFQSWEESSHKDVECSVCHYPPNGGITSKLRKKIEGLVMLGRYWTKLYLKSKPWAEIRDESCLKEGCHDKRLLEGVVSYNKVIFDHKVHFEDLKRGKNLQCTSCHSQIVQGQHITVTESSCFICHFKESEHYPGIGDCAHCHRKEELIAEETSRYNHSLVFESGFQCDKCHSNTIIGDGAVPRENCYKCHWETERLEQYENTDLMHDEHIAQDKIECNQCHMDIQHKIMKDIATIADCKTCHTDIHKSQEILYTGKGGLGIAHTSPNIMLEKGLSCKGCHIFHEEKSGRIMTSDTAVSKAEACESCHGKGFARIMKDWEIATEKRLADIRVVFNRARNEIRSSQSSQKKKAQLLLDEAAFNIDIVERGKGVHNIEYSQELLQASYDKIIESLRLAGSSYKPILNLAEAELIPTQCSNCHSGIEEINTQVFGLDFPHKSHLMEQKIQCDKCHSNVRTHGEFVATKKGCAVCHHNEPEKDCTHCHKLQTAFYKGGSLNGFQAPKDIMAEAEIECIDCHLNSNTTIDRSNNNKCLDCHETGYEELFTDWQATIRESIQSIKTSLLEKKKLRLTVELKNQINEIEEMLQKIETDGSAGIHNFLFMDETLTSMKQTLDSFEDK